MKFRLDFYLTTAGHSDFVCGTIYIDFQKQSVGSALTVLAKYLGTIINDVHFIVS